ncbi:MAG: EVE domain-containing protein, partial [Chloroflexota bacterium]|nr:EVE domain-containing protein [Chloroflexota bacterium]
MAIPDASREKLIEAMEHFDQEQRATSNWDTSPKYRYAIEHNGNRYPVKKIIGLATGVSLNTFSGGDEANHYVERRGLKVVRLHENGAYIFQSNPSYYDLPGAVNALREINWDVNRYVDSIHPGDTVYLWESGDNAGIVAVAHVTSHPGPLGAAPGEEPYLRSLRESRDLNQVRLVVDRVLPRRVTRVELKDHPVLSNMLIMRAPNSTNFKLTDEEAEVLADFIDQQAPDDDSIEAFLSNVPYTSDFVRNSIVSYIQWLGSTFGSNIALRPYEDRGEHGISVFYRGTLLQYLRLHRPEGLHILLPNPSESELGLLRRHLNSPKTLKRDQILSNAWAYESGYRFTVKTEQDYEWLKRVTGKVVQRMSGASARHTGLHAERIYTAAEQFVERALRRDDSLFTPGHTIWTIPNINELYRRFIEESDTSHDAFMVKFERQLSGAPPEVIQLASEMMFVHVILASRNSITAATKRQLVTTILGWSPSPAGLPDDLFQALDHGLAAMGVAFGTYRPNQLGFLLEFVRRWKTLPEAEQTRLLDDPWAFKKWLFAIPMHTAYAQREAILHIVHPDSFEAIVSRDHKQKIARAFASYVTEQTPDIDQQIAQIREKMTRQYGSNFNFYRDEVRNIWQNGGIVDPAPIPPLSGSLGSQLRPYVQLTIRLTEPSYSPDEIVSRLGQISPPIANLSASPSADDLVADLTLLRLLEQLPDGQYRRWEHLADATEEHLLRYAALTLLVQVPGQDDQYILPILNVSQDQLYSREMWPGGEGLLAWYEEARLVEQRDAGWQLRADALLPINATTPTAEAINTFLEHVIRTRASQAVSPDLEEDMLPVLDAATLDQRIGEIQRELLIDRRTILRIYRSLIAGRHVILSGPPGTGKTHLARILPRILWRDEAAVALSMPTRPELPPTTQPEAETQIHEGYAVDVVTATEDWGTRHVIGGIVPQLHDNERGRALVYGVRHGVLTRTLLQNYGGDGETIPEASRMRRQRVQLNGAQYRGRWLVIDEFTRAPIDAAFGSLLTTLGGQRDAKVAVPTDKGVDHDVRLPRDFRLIGTLNSFDRHFLNQMSEAMKRRFTFIDVLPPDRGLAATESAHAVYRALQNLQASGITG